ncbi:hypothetical protein LXM25_09500 [Dyadobacter sp. LJ53]|uniref:hypothetical protein n=1 Tax=Dyadobacter chenwenxiniae TaxID=2906456 RepID=UPI001F2A40ED|nr:hypothetical protein [Dyadobacter chenwenxiniae]MCF0050291.1 hypothetical protein [Dyadobacter chenwenxiniae]
MLVRIQTIVKNGKEIDALGFHNEEYRSLRRSDALSNFDWLTDYRELLWIFRNSADLVVDFRQNF